jgi:hypothetical protein
MKTIIITLVLALVLGCQRYGGGSSRSYANPDKLTSTEVVIQHDQMTNPIFVIAWTDSHGGGKESWSGRNLLTSIHGHYIHPSLDKQAVYALQSDHTVREIPLNQEQIAKLFDEIQQPDFHTSHSKLWQKEIAPRLITVEAPGGN